MSDHGTSMGHKKVLQALGKDIASHEASLVELRELRIKLIRVYERSKASELISHLHAELATYRNETL